MQSNSNSPNLRRMPFDLLFSVEVLTEFGIKEKTAKLYSSHLMNMADKYDVDNIYRAAMFLSQTAHESFMFEKPREIWGPTETQKGYEGRLDLGNTMTGDGPLFKGRGLLQITGRENYTQLSRLLYSDSRLVTEPKLLEQPEAATLSAGWFWKTRNLNRFADAQDVEGCTKRINGGKNGLKKRIELYNKALSVLTS